MKQAKPCGTWDSAITTDLLLQGAVGISEAFAGDNVCWWAESRPSEGGRTAIMKWQQGSATEITPADANVRTLVHEYGGGAWWADDRAVFYVDYADQCVYTLSADGSSQQLSPDPDIPRGLRFADLRPTPAGNWLLAVCERHAEELPEPENTLVAIALSGTREIVTLARGADFYGSPRISADGSRICWVQWNHPNMPWDDTELWQADIRVDESIHVQAAKRLAGGEGISIVQPEYSPQGVLHYLSDEMDLWQLYNEENESPVLMLEGEMGYPPWVFGLSRYCFKPDGRILAAEFLNGIERYVGTESYSAFHSLRSSGEDHVFVGFGWDREASIVLNGQEVHKPRDLGIAQGWLEAPEVIEFPTSDDDIAYALFFKPANPHYQPQDGEKPPLIVLAHGGPTAAASAKLNLSRQFWTSRGFAVVDVNYRGSSGFGRAYRKKLAGRWGIADVDDCVNAARFLAARGDVDESRLIIRGGSAGGYTVLCALAFHDVFSAGANMYGIADLEALAGDTHKFESRYLDGLVAAYPQAQDVYQQRSPINHLQGFNVPMIVLQGAEDAIVPPNQSRMIVDALDKLQVPVAYLEFEGEQHGFRQAVNIKRALESELEFYLRIFNLLPPDQHSDLKIRNL